MKVTVQKTVALEVALAKLHNYCIDTQDSCTDVGITAIDVWTSELDGAVPLVPVQVDDAMNQVVPEQLMGGGTISTMWAVQQVVAIYSDGTTALVK